MHTDTIINSGLGTLVLLSRAFLTHGSWARLVASYRLPRYLSYIAAKLATVSYGLPVARADLVNGPVQLIFDGVLLPICCPLPAPLAVPLAIINAAAWSAIVLYVEQQRQQQYAMTNYLSAFLGPLACPSLLLGSSGGVPVAALAGVRLAVTTLVSIALVSSTRRRNGGSRSSRAAHMLPATQR